jgi:hypothetical protein
MTKLKSYEDEIMTGMRNLLDDKKFTSSFVKQASYCDFEENEEEELQTANNKEEDECCEVTDDLSLYEMALAKQVVKKLVRMANDLDNVGLNKLADILDKTAEKIKK